MKECSKCGKGFELRRGKPGLIGECPSCSEDVERVAGITIWDGKNDRTTAVVTKKEAETHISLNKRQGVGVSRALHKAPVEKGNPGSKRTYYVTHDGQTRRS